jgi:alcohol dehydrogenase
VEDFNSVVCPEKFNNIAEALGKDVTGLTVKEASQEAINALIEMAEALNIPKLKDTKFNPEDIDKLSAQAMADVCTGGNPREVTIDDIKAIYMNAYNGNILRKTVNRKRQLHSVY